MKHDALIHTIIIIIVPLARMELADDPHHSERPGNTKELLQIVLVNEQLAMRSIGVHKLYRSAGHNGLRARHVLMNAKILKDQDGGFLNANEHEITLKIHHIYLYQTAFSSSPRLLQTRNRRSTQNMPAIRFRDDGARHMMSQPKNCSMNQEHPGRI